MGDSQQHSQTFEQLYHEHYVTIFCLCLSFAAGNRQWALDRSQDTFVKLALSLHKLDHHDDLGGWLYRVAVRQCLMELRRQKRWRLFQEQSLEQTHDVWQLGSERQIHARISVGELEHTLTTLPVNQQVLLSLMLFEDKNLTEAAELLGFSKGYASKLYQRAIATLKALVWQVDHD